MSDLENSKPALLIDLDGVIYQGDQAIKGAIKVTNWIRAQQIPYVFVTNTTSRSRQSVLEKLHHIGITASINDIITPLVATTKWLSDNQISRTALFLKDDAQQDFAGISTLAPGTDSGVEAVVIGDMGEAWDYQTLNRAFRLLMRDPQPVLIALGLTRYWQASDGLRLDVAPFVKALECASGCDATVIGKPSAQFFKAALELVRRKPGDAIMLGDDIVGDIQGAQKAGLRAVLVKTGKYRASDLSGHIKPEGIIDSIADLPRWLESHQRSLDV